jgi:MoxR-like ATPase
LDETPTLAIRFGILATLDAMAARDALPDHEGPASPGKDGPRSTRATLTLLRESLRSVVQGKDDVIDLLLVGLLGAGHVLVEDVPGVGKTTLAKALARALDVTFTRVQFTPDLLPTDILGSQVLNPQNGTFAFHKGPIFTNVLLADEINRASPRTQSALLEAMNEAQVSIDGTTHMLPSPFFVVATQNPSDYQGTYPLPEAQLDRFLLRIGVGYPSPDAELAMLFARQSADPLAKVTASFISISRTSRWMRTMVSRSQTAVTFASGSADCRAKSMASSPCSSRGSPPIRWRRSRRSVIVTPSCVSSARCARSR